MNNVLRTHVGDNRRLAVDKVEYAGEQALTALGIEIGGE